MEHKGMSLQRRLQLQVALVALILLLIGGWSLWQERATLLRDRQDKVRNLVENTLTLVQYYEAQASSGAMAEADAKRQAAAAITTLRYDGQEYFFVFDRDWTWVAHGAKPAMAGKNLDGIKDPTGTPLKPLFEQALREGGGKGIAQYVWDKPGFDTPQDKVSYIATSAKWGWVVGTGVYLDDVRAAFTRQAMMLGSVLALALAVVIVVGYLTRRSVMTLLGGEPALTREVVRRIAQGDLHSQVPLRAGDQDSLLAVVAYMQGQLRELVGGIDDSSRTLTGMAGNIAGNASAVACSSEQQSQAANAMAASVQQLTSSIKQISELAQHASTVSADSGTLSNQGGEVIANAVNEMQRINEAVDQAATTISDLAGKAQTISGIMQVIKDIADQTNLLALNAAIEAARAGETGRGFAVVADEVRKLSERTASATQEIAGMIRDIQDGSVQSRSNMEEAVNRVKAGLQLAEQGGAAIRQIRDSAGSVVGVVQDISRALSEQGHASEEITRHVEQIAQGAAGNADASSQASHAIGELNQLTGRLRSLVTRFQV